MNENQQNNIFIILPEEIIWYYLINQLKTFDFLFVNKYIYNCFWNRIKNNQLIMARYNRIKNGYDESIKTQNQIVKLDRLYFTQDSHLTIICKFFHNVNINIEKIKASLIYTFNAWKSKYEICPYWYSYDYKRTYKQNIINIYFRIIPKKIFGDYVVNYYNEYTYDYYENNLHLLSDMWFTIKLSYNNYDIYDNNYGWNYTILKKYHHIPIFKKDDSNYNCVLKWSLTES